jgi:hypothetical protein
MRYLTLFIILISLRSWTYANPPSDKLKTEVIEALGSSKSVTLYSLNPLNLTKDSTAFHGYKPLGKMLLSQQEIKRVYAICSKGLGYTGETAMCFDPRHGLRFISNKHTYDMLICFECCQVTIYKDGIGYLHAPFLESPDEFNKYLQAAHISISTDY